MGNEINKSTEIMNMIMLQIVPQTRRSIRYNLGIIFHIAIKDML